MQYFGKVLGLMMGYLSGMGLIGIIIGVLVGHLYDSMRSTSSSPFASKQQQTRQTLFFRTTFEVMGYLSKAKGRVTEKDIQMASLFMDRLNLYGVARQEAQVAFRAGKVADYPLKAKLAELRKVCSGRYDLLRMFLEIQLQMAFSDGYLYPKEKQILYTVAEELGISPALFEQYLRMMGYGEEPSHRYSSSASHANKATALQEAYVVLGVSEDDTPTVIKRAYRKRMAENHPDKLVAKGLPPEMMEVAKEKTQKIQQAYEVIKQYREFK